MKNLQSTVGRHLILFCVLGYCSGCATSADGTDSSANNKTVVASKAQSEETTTESTGGTDAAPVVIEEAGKAGRSDSGSKVYCRRRAPTGSRVAKTTCMTQEQRKKQQEYAKEIFRNADVKPLKN